jgi:glucose/arabinose dehydrogenase
MKSRILPIPFAALALAAHAIAGADPRGDNPGTLPSTPEQEKAKFHLPPGFEIQLVAAEPEIQKPINITFDGGGRLWVTGSEMYPWPASVEADGKPIPDFANAYAALTSAFHVSDKAAPASNVARDTVRVLSDFDETGRARKISVFADGLNIPSGVQPLPRKPGSKGDTVIVYSIPNIWSLEDTTGDGHADKREVLYGTAGFLDTHGGMSSFLYWMDGWIYGTHGFRNHSEIHDKAGRVTVLDSGNTYRFRPDGSAFEIYSHGQTNPFGLTVDPLGDFYTADSHSRPVYMLLRGGWYEGINKQHDGLGFARALPMTITVPPPLEASPTTPTTNGRRNTGATLSTETSSPRRSIATATNGTARRRRPSACPTS